MHLSTHASTSPGPLLQVWIRQHEVKEDTVLFQELPHALRNEVAWQACKANFRWGLHLPLAGHGGMWLPALFTCLLAASRPCLLCRCCACNASQAPAAIARAG